MVGTYEINKKVGFVEDKDVWEHHTTNPIIYYTGKINIASLKPRKSCKTNGRKGFDAIK